MFMQKMGVIFLSFLSRSFAARRRGGWERALLESKGMQFHLHSRMEGVYLIQSLRVWSFFFKQTKT